MIILAYCKFLICDSSFCSAAGLARTAPSLFTYAGTCCPTYAHTGQAQTAVSAYSPWSLISLLGHLQDGCMKRLLSITCVLISFLILTGKQSLPKIGVLTVSDRASTGIYQDLSGPIIVEVCFCLIGLRIACQSSDFRNEFGVLRSFLALLMWSVLFLYFTLQVMREYLKTECDYVCRVVPDEIPLIIDAIKSFSAAGCCMVCTTGGTGPSARDVTPEAMLQVSFSCLYLFLFSSISVSSCFSSPNQSEIKPDACMIWIMKRLQN